MRRATRVIFFCICVSLLTGVLSAQDAPLPPIFANPNRVPAGKFENGITHVALEIRDGVWHAEAEDGPPLFVQAFGEAGKPAQIPGPMLRVPENTTVHVTVANRLDMPATVHGFATRPANDDAGVTIAPGQTYEFTFASGSPGTYFYWAQTTPIEKTPGGIVLRPRYEDAQLNGAFIVDPPGPVRSERIFVLNAMFGRPNAISPGFEVTTINGKEYPYTDAPEYTMGDTIRWRILNPGFSEHPMHLHGSYYKIVSLGTDVTDTHYAADEQQSVVTEDMMPGQTMAMEWTPSHPGRWLFHCHFHLHMSSEERVQVVDSRYASLYGMPERVAGTALNHDPPGAMHDMGGLLMVLNIKQKPGTPAEKIPRSPRRLELVLQPNSAGHTKLLSCSIHEGNKVETSHDVSVGPPLVLTRDEPVEITLVNHLTEPATIHWHGLELDSYYDGVMGAGLGDKMASSIAPGASFVVRFTPNRAGTFIYHTHAGDPQQLSDGIYGALIVLPPGEKFDAAHERLIVIGTRDPTFDATHITVNGSETFPAVPMERGVRYRLRIVNMAPNLPGKITVGTKEHRAEWREIAKDGADVPKRLKVTSPADLIIASGETYDFEFTPQTAGEIPIAVINRVNGVKLEGKIVVQDTNSLASTK